MLPREVVRKAKKLEIITRRMVNDQMAGQYHSVFKGRGMDFDEVRPYHPGDDVRSIDWNVSARTGDLHIKRFVEERELTVFIVMDASSSVQFGTAEQVKRAVAAELATVLAFSAIRNNDRVGLLIFNEEVEKFIPPKKGKKHVLRVITEILGHESREAGTDVGGAMQYVSRVTRRSSVVFLISDFLTGDFERDLKLAAKRHDLVPIIIEDPMEIELPKASALVPVRDLETGDLAWLDLGSRRQREAYAAEVSRRRHERDRLFQRLKLDAVDVRTDESYVEPLAAFFRRRKNRY